MWVPDGDGYRLTAPLVWGIGRAGGPQVVVPAGFAFDVSVPRPLRPRFRGEAVLRAACLHDWCLADGWRWVAAAAVFEEVLAEGGVSWWRRAAMVGAVRMWGWVR
ncbi:DUF1353 domain-containing protein [Wenxinia saemankumensis]|uniref:DUF1353 domain-containing protein n=1 Tax=Wenxinia saemankumensis TaxID=1447782 RepID=A0A1M6F0S0_9RHOB|nr:DUF1353 domain-containing protein [Wenxinia saemankumensis]SHI91241.1 Protein of unknown function [Wenxinia saemankumensis]